MSARTQEQAREIAVVAQIAATLAAGDAAYIGDASDRPLWRDVVSPKVYAARAWALFDAVTAQREG